MYGSSQTRAGAVVAEGQLQQQALAIHQRLLRGDPTASLDAAELLLDPLVRRLRSRWPGPDFAEASHDTAVEAIVAYLASPDRYDQSKAMLLTWLTLQAHGDMINAYQSPQKRFEREWIVESALSSGEIDDDVPLVLGDQVPAFDSVPSLDASIVLASVRDAFPEERDRQLIWLMCVENNHSTEAAAAILGLSRLPLKEQVVAIKRHKDRIMRRLRRLGLDKSHE